MQMTYILYCLRYLLKYQKAYFSSFADLHLQARLGPGRLHHCMRLIGAAERGMQLMAHRALSRKAFGKMIAQHGSFVSDLAKVLELSKSKIKISFNFTF